VANSSGWPEPSLPAVLFEAGMIKRRDEELVLVHPQHQARTADATAAPTCPELVRDIAVPAAPKPSLQSAMTIGERGSVWNTARKPSLS
jgi:hypothetical protein